MRKECQVKGVSEKIITGSEPIIMMIGINERQGKRNERRMTKVKEHSSLRCFLVSVAPWLVQPSPSSPSSVQALHSLLCPVLAPPPSLSVTASPSPCPKSLLTALRVHCNSRDAKIFLKDKSCQKINKPGS